LFRVPGRIAQRGIPRAFSVPVVSDFPIPVREKADGRIEKN
jgi:hypothetical protein